MSACHSLILQAIISFSELRCTGEVQEADNTDTLNNLPNSFVADDFHQEIQNFEFRTTQSALDYGLTRIPNELLSEILFHAATGLKHTVALSHVCKRFRSVVASSPRMWAHHHLLSGWTPTQIKDIAERSGVFSVKGYIDQERHIHNLTESSKTILSLYPRLEELCFSNLSNSSAEEVRQHLSGSQLSALHTLSISDCDVSGNSGSFTHFYDTWETPALSTVHADFVPLPMLGKQLVRCCLKLFRFPLKELVDFLSSCNLLQELCIDVVEGRIAYRDHTDMLRPAALPSLVSLDISFRVVDFVYIVSRILQNIRPSTIPQLKLHIDVDEIDTKMIWDRFTRFREISPSIQSLELEFRTEKSWQSLHVMFSEINIDLGDICRHLPQSVETLSLTTQFEELKLYWDHSEDPFEAHSLRRFCLKNCSKISPVFVPLCRKACESPGSASITFEFESCRGVSDGTFTLESLESALWHRS